MNKNSNTLFGSKQNNTVVKNIVEAEPMMFGVPTESNKVGVKFAVHSGDAIAKGRTDGELVFNAITGNTGAIYLGDTLVSSKILDVTYAPKTDASAGIKEIVIKYLDDSGVINTTDALEVVDDARVAALIADFKKDVFDPYKTATDASIARIDTSVNNLEDWAKAVNITSDEKAIVIGTSDVENGFKNYTVNLKINGDEKVLSQDANGLTSTLKLNLVPATGGTPAVLYTDAAEAKAAGKHVGDVKTPAVPASGAKLQILGIGDAVVTEMAADNFLIDGMLETAEIHKTVEDDGTQASFLHLVWNTAAGSKETEINLTDLIDIENVTSSNTTYLTSAIDGGKNITLTPIVKTAAETHYVGESGFDGDANVTAIPDAASFKKYIDEKSTNLAVSASGDTYVNAAVDASNNKKINVSANVNELTVNKVGEGDTTISGVSTTLVSGGEVATKVSTFVNNRIDEEIKKLDVPEAIVNATNASFKYSETDGKVSISDFALDYSSVTKTPTTSTANAPKTDAAIAVTNGSKLAVGSDIEKVAQYAADKVTEEKHRVDAKIAALGGDVTSDDNAVANVEVKTKGGQVSDVIVTTISAGVNRDDDAQGARKLAATTPTGALVGSDVALIKGYVDDKIADVTGAQDSAVTVLDASSFITTTITMVDGALNQDQSSLSYKKAVYANDSNTVTTNGLVDGQLALDMINDRIADLDKEAITSKDTNEYVSITLKVEDGISSITSVAVKTQEVSTATADNEGLATAFSTRNYIDTRLTWAVI